MLLDFQTDSFREPAECVITVDGKEVPDLYPFLTGVSVDVKRSQPAAATLDFETRRDEQGQWLVLDEGILNDWSCIGIEVSFGKGKPEPLFLGYIKQISTSFPGGGKATISVTCQDASIPLDRLHRRKVWGAKAPTSDTLILEEILSHHNLYPHPDNGSGQSGIVVNQDGTDADFLRKRADANGYELAYIDRTVYFGTWRLDSEVQPTIMIDAGMATNCLSFSVNTDGHQPDAVSMQMAASTGSGVIEDKVLSNLPLMGTRAAESSLSGLDHFNWRLSREGGADQQVLKAKAQSKANELAMKVKASGELDGSLYGHVLHVGKPVKVDGVGDWLGGAYYVDSVTHKFAFDGYRQSFNLLRNAFGDNSSSGARSALSPIV